MIVPYQPITRIAMIFHLVRYDSYIDEDVAMTNGMMCFPMTIVRSSNI